MPCGQSEPKLGLRGTESSNDPRGAKLQRVPRLHRHLFCLFNLPSLSYVIFFYLASELSCPLLGCLNTPLQSLISYPSLVLIFDRGETTSRRTHSRCGTPLPTSTPPMYFDCHFNDYRASLTILLLFCLFCFVLFCLRPLPFILCSKCSRT